MYDEMTDPCVRTGMAYRQRPVARILAVSGLHWLLIAMVVLLAVSQYANAGVLRITATSPYSFPFGPDENFIVFDDPWFDSAPVGSIREFTLADVDDFRFSVPPFIYDPGTVDPNISDFNITLLKSGTGQFENFYDTYILLSRFSIINGGIGGCFFLTEECIKLTLYQSSFPSDGIITEASAFHGSVGLYNVTWNASFTPGSLPPTNVAEPPALLLLSLGLAGLGFLCAGTRRAENSAHKNEWRHA